MAEYGWAIDRDYLFNPKLEDASDVGIGQVDPEQVRSDNAQLIFRRVTIRTDLSAASIADPVRFRISDEDGDVYYGGAISRQWLDDDELVGAPLAFAEANAGATIFEVRNADGDWEAVIG